MADSSAPVQDASKEKKKRKSNLKKSGQAVNGVGSEEASSTPESRKASLATPTSQDDVRKTSLTPPTSQEDGHKVSLTPPTPQEDGRKASLTTLTPQEDGRKASLDPPTLQEDGRKATLAPPTLQEDGLKASLAPPTSQDDVRKTSLTPPTPQEDGRKASLTTPTPQEDARKTSLAPPTLQEDGRKASLAPPTLQEDGRKASLAPPTHEQHEPQRGGSLKHEERPKRRLSARKASSVLEDLDEAKLLELKEAFKLFDLDQDGYISKVDLKQTFGTLGRTDVTDEELQQMLSEAANPLDFDAFVMLLGFKTISLDPEEILLEALGKWDKDNSGFIPEEIIRHDLMTWGDKFTAKEVDVALEDAPTFVNKGKNMIDYIKFCKLLCGLRKKTRDITIEDFLT